ncbi:MAG: HNH/ENDO VII family nuclease [Clostridia bacterium]|nr:HNH/ENDO VII family nuclease [Clostridia bacterium]
METKYPVDVIKNFQTIEQYEICKKAGLTPQTINGKVALIRDIDLDYIDENGLTNLQRMNKGISPLDSTGTPYEIHHIGQKTDSTLAILTRTEHRQAGNHKIWHYLGNDTDNPSTAANWNSIRESFWKTTAKSLSQ